MKFQSTSVATKGPNVEQLVLEIELEPGSSDEVALKDAESFPPIL